MPRLVSVIIPSYKTAYVLPEAIESALKQTIPRVEVIVVNDGSPDDTRLAARPYRDRIIYVDQENRGLAAARNAGFRVSSGDFLCFLDADDLLLPHKFECQLELFSKEPDLGVVLSGYIDVEEDGKTEIRTVEKRWHRNALEHLLNHEVFPPHVPLIRRTVLEQSGLFPENTDPLEFQEDWQLWLSFALDSVQFSSVGIPTCKYRHRSSSFSASDPLRHMDGARRVVEWLRNDPRAAGLTKEIDRLSAIVDLGRIARAYRFGCLEEASRAFAGSMKSWPEFWREPSNMLRLFTTCLSLHEQKSWSEKENPLEYDRRAINEMLPEILRTSLCLNHECREFIKNFKSLQAIAYLTLSDLSYSAQNAPLRRKAIENALRHSVASALSKQGRKSLVRGMLGHDLVTRLKRLMLN